MILKRTISALAVAAAVTALFLYLPLWAFTPILLVLSALVQLEFYQMAQAYEPVPRLGILAGSVWLGLTGFFGFGNGVVALMRMLPSFLVIMMVVTAIYVLLSERYRKPLGTMACTLFGFLYIPFMLSFFLLIAQMGVMRFMMADGGLARTGIYSLLSIVAVTKLSDMGGFAFGLSFGKHKMCPAISPKKSWEGLAGSMFASAIGAMGATYFAQAGAWGNDIAFWRHVTYLHAAIGGCVVALVATAGDLVESRLKRECNVKDSSSFLPAGMGGLLDTFDSLLFVPALCYPLLVLCY